MMRKRVGVRVPIRYSEAFKREVVREVEQAELTYAEAQRKYGRWDVGFAGMVMEPGER